MKKHIKKESLVSFEMGDPAVRYKGVATEVSASSMTVHYLQLESGGIALRETMIEGPSQEAWLGKAHISGLSTGCLALLAFIHPDDDGKMELPKGWAKFIVNENDLRGLMDYYLDFNDCLEIAGAFGNNLLAGFLETTWSDRLRAIAPRILLEEFAWLAAGWSFGELKDAGVFSLGPTLLGLYPFDPENPTTDMAAVLGILLGHPRSREEKEDPERHMLLNALLPRLLQTTENGRYDETRGIDYGADILERLPDDFAFLCADHLLSAHPTYWFQFDEGAEDCSHPLVIQAFIQRAEPESLLAAALEACAQPRHPGNAALFLNTLPQRNCWTGFALSCLLGSYYTDWDDISKRDTRLPRFIQGLENRLNGGVEKRLHEMYPDSFGHNRRLLQLVHDQPELMLYGLCLRGKRPPRIEKFEYEVKRILKATKALAVRTLDIESLGEPNFAEWIDTIFTAGVSCLDPARVKYVKAVATRA